ncbi:transcription antitermination factor NusB [Rhizobiaceae bacterium]|nr:transcription antitermination factor NusB [Rhizobiaceae bacterium]
MPDPSSPREQKPANKRGNARLAAVQALYQMDVAGTGLTETVAEYENFRLGREVDGEQYRDADPSWFRGIVAGVVKDQKAIDPVIHRALAEHWKLERLDSILRATLRAAVFELRSRKDVSARVIVSEYVEVAKAFFDGDEPKTVNGVLNRVARDVRDDAFDDAAGAAVDEASAQTDG